MLGANVILGFGFALFVLSNPGSSNAFYIIASLGILYGSIFLYALYCHIKYPIYELDQSKLEILKLFKANSVIDISKLDKIEESDNYVALYTGDKLQTLLTSTQIGKKQLADLTASIKVIANH